MTAIVARLSPGGRALMEAVATCACLAFLAMVLWPAWQHAADDADMTTPALELSNLWRGAAMPVGIALMGLFAILRLLREASAKHIATALVLVGSICAAFWFARGAFEDLGRLNLVIFFVGVAAGSVLAGIPIAFAFGLGTFGYLALATGTPMPVMVGRMDEGMSHLILLAVPLFVFLGQLLEATGMARAMVAFLAGLLGHVRGGLQYVLVGAMYLVSGISGAKAADMAAVAPALFPEMKARGADEGELVALLAATGAQTEDGAAEPGADHHRLGSRACRSRRCSPAAWCPRWCWASCCARWSDGAAAARTSRTLFARRGSRTSSCSRSRSPRWRCRSSFARPSSKAWPRPPRCRPSASRTR